MNNGYYGNNQVNIGGGISLPSSQTPYYATQQQGFGSGAFYQNHGGIRLATFGSNLTPEEMAMLKNDIQKFTLAMTKEEGLISKCNHQDEYGAKIVPTTDGKYMCTICGETFVGLDDLPMEKIIEGVNICIDTMQWIKVLNVFKIVPDEVLQEYMVQIAMLSKLPNFFQIIINAFEKANRQQQMQAGGRLLLPNGIITTFQALNNNMMPAYLPNGGYYNNGAFAGQYMMQQNPQAMAATNKLFQNPQFQQAPGFNLQQPGFVAPQQPMYGQPQQPMFGQQFQPTAPVQPQQAPGVPFAGPYSNPAPAPMYGQAQQAQMPVMPTNGIVAQAATNVVSPVNNPLDINNAISTNPVPQATAQPQTQTQQQAAVPQATAQKIMNN